MKWIYYIVFFLVGALISSSLILVHHVIALERKEIKTFYPKHEIRMDIPNISFAPLKEIVSKELEQRKKQFLKEISNISLNEDFTYTFLVTSESFSYQNYLSYAFFLESYTGGAHPEHDVFTIVYDTSQNEIVDLSSFLSYNQNILNYFASCVRSELLFHPSILNVTFLMEGTKPIAKNYQRFVFTENGILFYFIPYSIAPYSSGMFQVVVPF